jgi:hypothetical protein
MVAIDQYMDGTLLAGWHFNLMNLLTRPLKKQKGPTALSL